MKVITIIGARPQFIKAAAVSRVLRAEAGVEEKIIHTGQHYDANMSDVFFREMDIPMPDFHLDIHGVSHGAMTGRMLEQIEAILVVEKPDVVLVYGDTNSTLAGALAAKKLGICIVHVEAGLRSFNMSMPEEINRILTDRISDVLYCPTQTAVDNLLKEGFAHFDCDMVLCGDVMEDAAMYYADRASSVSTIIHDLNLQITPFVLCTLHRQENTDSTQRLEELITTLNEIQKEICVVLPIHPRTAKMISNSHLILSAKVIPPVGYFDMLQLIRHSRLVLTDSGGLQKEAYFFDKYCITLREDTEWTELVSGGFNRLVGSDRTKILEAFYEFMEKPFSKGASLFGGGHAAEKIVQHLLSRD